MDPIFRDFKYALRGLARSPGFTSAAVLTLGLGIGAVTAIFSIVHGVILQPLSYREPDRLFAVWETKLETDAGKSRLTAANYLDYRRQNQVFEELALFGSVGFNLTGQGEPELLRGARVSAGYFPVLGVEPLLGRTFLAEEDQPGGEPVVVLGYGLWQRRFGAASDVLGRTISLDGNPYTVVGVMPSGVYPSRPASTGTMRFLPQYNDLWVAIVFTERLRGERGSHVFGAIGRLKEGISRAEAQAEMDVIARRLEQEYPGFNQGEGALLSPLADEVFGDVRPALFILLGAVALVLLIACGNVAGLVLARGSARQKELAVRASLGAGRLDLIRQLLAESVLLGLFGGILGTVLAAVGVDVLVRLSPQEIPRLPQVGMDFAVLAFAFIVSLLTGIVFGLTPALRLSRTDFQEELKEGGRSSAEVSAQRGLRPLLVVAEVALAVMLVIGGGLLMKSFRQLAAVNPGFGGAKVLAMDLMLSPSKYSQWHEISSFHTRLLESFRAVPGVRSAALGYDLPLETNWYDDFLIEGRPEPEPGEVPMAVYRPVGAGYFRSLAIPLMGGRPFNERDDPEHPGAVIINESLVNQYFPNEDPLGKRLLIDGPSYPWGDAMPSSFEIVGIVRDVKFNGIGHASEAAFYVPARQHPLPDMSVFVRAEGDPLDLLPALQRELWALDPDMPIAGVTTMEDLLSGSIALPRFNTLVLGLLGATALLLAAIGIYGLLSYTVSQRSHEIGIRMALGARSSDVVQLVVRQGLFLTLLGLGLGLVGAAGLTRAMESLLFGVSKTDPATFLAVAAFVTVVALLASYLPARRASRVDCMTALRHD